MEWVTSNRICSGWFRNCKKLIKTPVHQDIIIIIKKHPIDSLERVFKESNDVELGEEEDFGDEAITGSVQLLVVLLVQVLVLLRFSKICHGHLHLFNHHLVKAVIKRQDGKLLERKWRKCWKIAEIKKLKEKSQRLKPVQIQSKKIFIKTYQRGWRDSITFFQK